MQDTLTNIITDHKILLDDKAWRHWDIPTQECVNCSLK